MLALIIRVICVGVAAATAQRPAELVPSCGTGDAVCLGAAGADDEESLLIQLRQGHQAESSENPPPDEAAPRASVLEAEECHMENSSSGCSMSSFAKDRPTMVIPGGNSACLYNGDPYKFTVYPGDADKLMIYFAGGGACWASADGKANLACFTGIGKTAQSGGVFDRERSEVENPFRSYTVVYINYCTGDLHLGTRTAEWDIKGKKTPVNLVGYHNAKLVVQWAQRHFGGSKLSSFIIGGASAGSIANQVWAARLLKLFKYERAAVFVDSFAGAFPSGSVGPLLRSWGACEALEQLGHKCRGEHNPITPIFGNTLRLFKNVPFCSIQSKVDSTQMLFYSMVGASEGVKFDPLTPGGFYHDTNNIFGSHAEAGAASSNYRVFYALGDKHILTSDPGYYTTTAFGHTLSEWLASFAQNGVGGLADSACDGRTVHSTAGLENSTDYCLAALRRD